MFVISNEEFEEIQKGHASFIKDVISYKEWSELLDKVQSDKICEEFAGEYHY